MPIKNVSKKTLAVNVFKERLLITCPEFAFCGRIFEFNKIRQ